MSDALEDDRCVHRVLAIFSTPDPAGLVHDSLEVDVQRRARSLSVSALRSLRQHFSREPPAIVIAYGSEALRYCALVKPRATRLVYSKTGVLAEDLSGPRFRVHRWLAQRADHVAAVSSETAREAETLLRVPRQRITMVSNGRDPEKFSPVGSTHRRRPTLLWVGHVTTTKQPGLFIEAVLELRSAGLDFDALLAGDGPEMERLRPRAQAADVRLLGRRGDVGDVMRSADIFVFTGERAGEGLPGVLIEASLSALPIVTTDVPGARDVVIHGSTGYVMTDRTTASLAGSLASLITDKHLRQSMGRNGRQRGETLFTVASSAARWRSLLTDLLATDA